MSLIVRTTSSSEGEVATKEISPTPDDTLLSSVTVPPGVTVAPKGLVLIVGPNSAGKTQFLKDIQAILVGQARDLVVCSNYQLTKPQSSEKLLEHLLAEGYFRKERTAHGDEMMRQTAPHLGGGSFRGHNVNAHQITNWFNAFRIDPGGRHVEGVPFLDFVGHCLTTALFLENRLILANQSGQFDYATQPPNNDLQALYLSKSAKRNLTEETQGVFGKAVWLDNSRGGILCLRVNQSPKVPSAEDRQEPEEMGKYRQIESEGDGMRSYVGICIALLLGRRPVSLIDEPELCLHPPQAHAMGRFIGRYGTSSGQAVFASTHSSHVLRGVIEATNNVQILRLTKVGGDFRGHMIGYDALKECMKRPIVRAETILDGIFADAVTIVESEGDRAVYQAAWEGLRSQKSLDALAQSQIRRDVLFIPVGGTGGIADIASFYRTLRIPVSIIADLDLLLDRDKLSRLLGLICDPRMASEVAEKAKEIADEIKRIPPSLGVEEVRQSLASIAGSPMDWSNEDDARIKLELSRLSKKIDRMRRLKNGGVEAFKNHQTLYANLQWIVSRCRSVGLFLVPVGELEYWCPALMEDGPAKDRKGEWANQAAMRIRETPEKAGDLLNFMQQMAEFHAAESQRMA